MSLAQGEVLDSGPVATIDRARLQSILRWTAFMAWIKMIEESEATGELKHIYETQRRQAGALANILKIHSLAPKTLSAHLDFYLAVLHAPVSCRAPNAR
jgi:hypothetical protein